MKLSRLFVPIAAIAMLGFSAVSTSAHAGDWHESRTAHAAIGLGAGLLIGYSVGKHNNHGYRHSNGHYRSHGSHSYHRPRASYSYGSSCNTRSYQRPYRSSYSYSSRHYEPVRERVVYRDPVYVQPAPANDSYYSYKEKSVWPFYRETDVEVIPRLSQPGPSNPQTRSNSEYARILRGETAAAATTTAQPNVQIIQNFNGVDPSQVETKVQDAETEPEVNVNTESKSSSQLPAVQPISGSAQPDEVIQVNNWRTPENKAAYRLEDTSGYRPSSPSRVLPSRTYVDTAVRSSNGSTTTRAVPNRVYIDTRGASGSEINI